MEDPLHEYQSSLEDLTFNSKPHINVLTILAEENKEHAEKIVQLIEDQMFKVKFDIIFSFLFLEFVLSSIIKFMHPLIFFLSTLVLYQLSTVYYSIYIHKSIVVNSTCVGQVRYN